MKNISIIINHSKNKSFLILEKLIKILESYNVNIEINNIKKETELIFSLGGDGTFVRTIKNSTNNAPIIGINCGTLGFLTEINETNINESLEKIFSNNYTINNCDILQCELRRKGKVIASDFAINDVVISRSSALEMIRFDVYINNKKIKQYNADGFIVATPLGSTAYSLSCGGPLIEPTSKLIELTPIASHSLINRSIVVDDTKEIKLKIVNSRNNNNNTLLSIDGNDHLALEIDDEIIIKKSERDAKILSVNNESFVENIAKKMFES